MPPHGTHPKPGSPLRNTDGTPQGFAPSYVEHDVEGPWQPTFLEVPDLDGDGIFDIVLGNSDSTEPANPIVAIMGRGDGTFEAAASVFIDGRLWGASDLDADGSADLLVSDDMGFHALLGVPPTGQRIRLPSVNGSVVPIGDLNADLAPDLAPRIMRISDNTNVIHLSIR